MTAKVKLTEGEWREELQARSARAFDAASSCEKAYGFDDERTQKAWRHYDAIGVLVRIERA
jgi:hypothetical protein